MAGMMVAPSLEARHDEEYSAEAGRQRFDVTASVDIRTHLIRLSV